LSRRESRLAATTNLYDICGPVLRATPENWKGPEWIRKTLAPIAELLDRVEPVSWQQREPRAHVATDPRKNRWGFLSPPL